MTHLDSDVLAEFRAGLITGRRGARITAHLAGCERCTELDDQLAGVSVLLASIPAPAMPDRVAQRLDTVLAAEVTRRDNAERARGDGAGESPAPRRPRGNRGFRPLALRVLAPAAAVVLLAAGGYGLSRAGLGASSEPAATSAGGAASRRAARRRGPATPTRPPREQCPGRRGSRRAISSSRPATRTSPAPASRSRSRPCCARRPRAPGEPSRSCATACSALAGGHTLQRVESVHFEGRPAILIVARTGAGGTAWITAPDCSATNRHVLDTTSLP